MIRDTYIQYNSLVAIMFERSYVPNYFSMEDIIVTQEKVPCRTLTTYKNLGWLKPGNSSEHLDIDTSVDLPLWMVVVLARKPDSLRIESPKIYQEKAREIFKADAKVINLFRVNQYYYELGMYLCMLNVKDHEPIQNVITQTFRERLQVLMDWADNVMTEPSKIQQLDNSEKSLLKSGQKARMELDEWLIQGSGKMKPAEIIVNLMRRKHFSLEGD